MLRVRGSTAVLSLSLLCLTGCGAIFNGTRQDVMANSSPDGASIAVAPTGAHFTTPTSMSLERKQDYHLTFTKEGYDSAKVDIEHHMNAGILVLDILSGLVGIIVDAATGAWNNLTPSTVQAALTKTDANVQGPASIRIDVTMKGGTLSIQSSQPGVGVNVRKD